MNPMLLYLQLAAVALTASSASVLSYATNINVPSNADTSCRADFTYYEGWCVYHTAYDGWHYPDAVNICSNKGVFGPSIHSENDLNFWESFADNITYGEKYFWVDAYCPSAGQKYVWRDGTTTDYFGPKDELLNCVPQLGYELHSNGLYLYGYYPTFAPALCAYLLATGPPTTTMRPLSSTLTTVKSTTTMPTTLRTTTNIPTTPKSISEEYCTCNPSSIYLDIVFVVDTSAAMPRDIIGDATATIQSSLYGLTFGTDTFQSNIAAIAYADSVQTVLNFGDLKSAKDIGRFSIPYLGGNSARTADAINQASAMIASNGRNFTRGVIVLLSNSFYEIDASSIIAAANSFKGNGGILITIDYSIGLGISGLANIATTGYYIANAAADLDLNSDMLYAFCDANCFCRDGLSPYNVANTRGRELPNGCYHVSDFTAVYYAAEQNCLNQKGFVATIHDDDKNFFMTSLFPVKAPFWIGLEMTNDKGKVLEWADGSTDTFTNWSPGNPVDGMDCVYGQQQTGFNSPWYSAPCADPLKNSKTYACQLPPCSSEYDCWA